MSSSFYYTRRLISSCIGVIYTCAFISYVLEWRGLASTNGILPSLLQLENNSNWCLIKYHHHLGLNVDNMIELISILGIICSVICSIGYGNMVIIFIMIINYYSLISVTEPFYNFQWDILLIEAGVLIMIWVPLFIFPYQARQPSCTLLWVIRFLLFKLMLMSGLAKIQSNGPTWLNYTALQYHFATQCIPNPVSWYAHNLIPTFLLKLGVKLTFIIEIPAAFLILLPFKVTRLLSFGLQVLLQLLIIATGNYVFFNFLTIVLCISLLDDDILAPLFIDSKQTTIATASNEKVLPELKPLLGDHNNEDDEDDEEENVYNNNQSQMNYLHWVHLIDRKYVKETLYIILSWLFLVTYYYFGSDTITSSEGVTKIMNICNILPILFSLFVIGLCVVFLTEIFESGREAFTITLDVFERLSNIDQEPTLRYGAPPFIRLSRLFISMWAVVLSRLFVALCAIFIFSASAPQFFTASSVCPNVEWSFSSTTSVSMPFLSSISAVNSYGLFRRITGVGPNNQVARPELILDYSIDKNCDLFSKTHCTWTPIRFYKKPDDINRAPVWILPFQSFRLDWLMWFEALYPTHSHWFRRFTCGLFNRKDNSDIVNLLNMNNVHGATYLRIRKFHYTFSDLHEMKNNNDNDNDVKWHVGRWYKRQIYGPEDSQIIHIDEHFYQKCAVFQHATTESIEKSHHILGTILYFSSKHSYMITFMAISIICISFVLKLLAINDYETLAANKNFSNIFFPYIFSAIVVVLITLLLSYISMVSPIILTMIGYYLSNYMNQVHEGLLSDPFCDINDKISCTLVSKSAYSSLLFGYTNSSIGKIYYILLTTIIVLYWQLSSYYFLLLIIQSSALFAMLMSIYLTYILTHVIQKVCVLCYCVHIINVGIFFCFCIISHYQN